MNNFPVIIKAVGYEFQKYFYCKYYFIIQNILYNIILNIRIIKNEHFNNNIYLKIIFAYYNLY